MYAKAVTTSKTHGPRRTMTVDRYMTPTPHTIGKDQMLSTAHETMREYKIRHLPVLAGGHLVGLLSDRDLHLVETLRDVDPHKVSVEQAMSQDPFQVKPTDSLEATVREMARKKYGSAVVVDGNRVVGIFTAIDALEALAWLLDERDDNPTDER